MLLWYSFLSVAYPSESLCLLTIVSFQKSCFCLYKLLSCGNLSWSNILDSNASNTDENFYDQTVTLSSFWHGVFSCSWLVFLAFILKRTTKLLIIALSSHNHRSTYIDSRQKDLQFFTCVAIDLFYCYCNNKCK